MNTAKRIRFFSIALLTTVSSAACVLPTSYASASPSRSASGSVVYYEIYNYGANKCLGNNSSGQSDIGNCTGSTSQTWFQNQHTMIGGLSYVQLKNVAGNCLGLAGGTGPQLVVGPCSGTSDHSQFWYVNWFYSYAYELVNGHTGETVETKGGGTSGGTLVIEGCLNHGPTCQWESL